ncbi:HEPN domain-containing protein [Brachybacterium paraconglomeratum]|uniref:HEPN domain-containing protein n=1 Tax=Brachybacterium paraconglomeratum TaxID=173362 RepID=UPI003879D6C7
MPRLYGSDEVRSQQKQLTIVFALVEGVDVDPELTSHFARYLCVRLAGFAEKSLKDLVVAHARARSSATVHRFVEGQMGKVWGINQSKLKDVLDALDPGWWDPLASRFSREIDALNSVGKLRDSISHGGPSGIGIPQVQQYRDDIYALFYHLCELLDPKQD